jgi:hypothetical protein
MKWLGTFLTFPAVLAHDAPTGTNVSIDNNRPATPLRHARFRRDVLLCSG